MALNPLDRVRALGQALGMQRLTGMAYLSSGNVIKLLLGFATSALVFRSLGPDNTGRLALTLSIIGLLSVIGEFGLRDTAVKEIVHYLDVDKRDAELVARTFVLTRILLGCGAMLVAFLAAGFIATRFYPDSNVAGLVRLGAFSLLSNSFLAVALVLLEAQGRFGRLSSLFVVQSILRAGFIVLLFFSGQLTVVSLLLLEVVLPLLVFGYSMRALPRGFIRLRRPYFTHLGRMMHFTKWLALGTVAVMLVMRLDILLLSYYESPVQVGIYAAAVALIQRFGFVHNSVLTTSFPEACRQTDAAGLRRYVRQSLRLTGLISAGFVLVFFVGRFLILLLYGQEYAAAVYAFYPLLAAFIITLNVGPVAYVLYPLHQPKWIAGRKGLQLLTALVVGLWLIPRFGMMGAATMVLVNALLLAAGTALLVWYFLWRHEELVLPDTTLG